MTPATGDANQLKVRWALLGASRGLGKSFSNLLAVDRGSGHEQLVISRKSKLSFDFSDETCWPKALETIDAFNPDYVIYFAGGGPFGDFRKKNWPDHTWSWRVNFLFPAFLIYSLQAKSLRTFMTIGSAVAEKNPDPKAASYAAGKHALIGLVSSLKAEKSLPFDVDIFSAPYMNTNLLPKNSWPVKSNHAKNPADVAMELFSLFHV